MSQKHVKVVFKMRKKLAVLVLDSHHSTTQGCKSDQKDLQQRVANTLACQKHYNNRL